MQFLRRLVLFVAASVGTLHAQEPPSTGGRGTTGTGCYATIVIRLFPLEYISNADAAKLVAPFIPASPYCGVFDAGGAVRGVTVKAPKDVIERVDSLLKAHDRAPQMVVLRFQLIAALDSNVMDPTIPADVQGSLKDLLKFGGYRVLAQGATSLGARNSFETTMTAGAERFTVKGMVWNVRVRTGAPSATSASAELTVELVGALDTYNAAGNLADRRFENLLSTGVTAQVGQTVVLGSAAGANGRRALILTVRPELLNERR